MTNIAFNATIISDDNVLEEDETFYLTIDSSSLPNDITTGSPLQVTVTIMDDDCKQFYLYSWNDKWRINKLPYTWNNFEGEKLSNYCSLWKPWKLPYKWIM